MHAPSPMALLLIAIVVLVLFGRGKVSSLMGEVGKGITAFKKGVKEGSEDVETTVTTETKAIETKTVDELDRARAELAAEREKFEAERAAAARNVTPVDKV